MLPEHRKQMDTLRDNLMANTGIIPGSMESTVFYALAFVGEAGEYANIVKKIMRDGDSPELRTKLRKELADCLIYMEHILDDQGLNKDEVIGEKLQELKERWPEHFNKSDGSITITHCSVCGEIQFESPGGITCSNGHGGADSKEEGNV